MWKLLYSDYILNMVLKINMARFEMLNCFEEFMHWLAMFFAW